MKTVKIFLASSVVELEDDRNAIGNFVRALRDIYDARGVKIELYDCTYENQAMTSGRKQDEHNEHARQSDMFLALFYNKAGKFTVEEFHEAYKQLQNTGAPAILVCFREGAGYAPKDSLLAFRDELEDELEQHPITYTGIDSVSLKVLLQMQRMNLDVPIKVEESMITVGGTPVLTLKNIPMWAKNADFQSLKEQYQACERAYLDAKAATTDPVTDPVFLRASEQWNEAKKNLRELEQELFAIALKIEEKNNDGTLTERQRKAYELMEQGDAEGANNILDLREILDDVAHAEALAQQADEKLEQHVQEMLQKIEILKTQVQNPSRFDQIKDIFEKTVNIEERNHLTKIAMREYVSYLHDQKDYSHAIPLAKQYLNYVEQHGDESDIADAANLLGISYAKTNRMELAEQEFVRVKEIYEQLETENPLVYLSDLAMSYNNLGSLYAETERADEAEQEYFQAKEIYEQLATEHSSAHQPGLADTCSNLGILYVKTDRTEEAKREFLRSKEIREHLTAENPSAYQPALAGACQNLGALYAKTKHMEEAKQEYLQAKKIREQLAAENPLVYQLDLASSYNDLGFVYSKTDHMDEAEQEYLRAKEIYEQLEAERLSAYQPGLATTCNNLGMLYLNIHRIELAEQEFLQSKEIYEQLIEISPEQYASNLQMVCTLLDLLSDSDVLNFLSNCNILDLLSEM